MLNTFTRTLTINYWHPHSRNFNKVCTKEYWLDAIIHRTTGPAQVSYYTTGAVHQEKFYRHGGLHNECGPASLTFDLSGNVLPASKVYYINGHRISKKTYRILCLVNSWEEGLYETYT